VDENRDAKLMLTPPENKAGKPPQTAARGRQKRRAGRVKRPAVVITTTEEPKHVEPRRDG
jgi:hypothetical protein